MQVAHSRTLKKLREAGCAFDEGDATGTAAGTTADSVPKSPKTPRKRKTATDNDDGQPPKKGRGRPKKADAVKDEAIDVAQDVLKDAYKYLKEGPEETPA
jgi:hypothetical protein